MEKNQDTNEIQTFRPYISDETRMREFTLRALLLGSILGIIFAASSVYLALKVGMTVSASIPIAVLSITLFKVFGKATILENNIVQTTGSAGESIAFGVATTMPVYLLLGQEMQILPILLIALLGGILGVLMMIPLRQGLIVKEHGKLTYPEGTACADVLIVGEEGGTNAKTVFLGFGVGALFKFLYAGLKLWLEAPTKIFNFFKGASISGEVAPELLGVGYIIGPKVACNMAAGGILSFMILIPAIKIFGENLTTPIFPSLDLIRDMSPGAIRNAYVLYIGAGAVATGGIISLIRSLPTIIHAFSSGIKTFIDSRRGVTQNHEVKRTEKDLPLSVVVFGSLGLVLAIYIAPILHINALSAILIILFGFFFVTVSSRITGEIGSSSNPISGMTVATLLITCLLFLAAGWTGVSYRAMALATAAIVCIAASNGGTISQDLKTGYLVGATPKLQQIAISIGVATSALVIGWTLFALNNAYTTIVPREYPEYQAVLSDDTESKKCPDGRDCWVHYITEQKGNVPIGKYLVDSNSQIAYLVDPGIAGVVSEVDGKPVTKLDSPKARLFSLIIDGILTRKLPWGLVMIGIMLALMMELVGVAALPFAVGLYLPVSTSIPILAGGFIRYLVDKRRKTGLTESEFSPGVLLSSGFIAGSAIMGVLIAVLAGFGVDSRIDLSGYFALSNSNLFALFPFLALMVFMYFVAIKNKS